MKLTAGSVGYLLICLYEEGVSWLEWNTSRDSGLSFVKMAGNSFASFHTVITGMFVVRDNVFTTTDLFTMRITVMTDNPCA
jgi:hypothetical protein